MYRFIGIPILTGRLKMFCRLLILVFFNSMFWTPTVNHVIHKRAAFYIANETMCIVDGDVYRNGDPVPTDDECERCTCRPPGFSCVLRDCDTKPGCKAVRRVGECCPEYVCGCVHNSRLYEDGELIKDLQNNCYTCRCHGSSISCTFADCRFRSDCPPEYIPGECCPRYDHCPTEKFTTITTTTTTTTTAAPSSPIIQQEIDLFNLTTHHLQKFTTEGTTVKVEEITVSPFTTPSYTHFVKFTLSGEKISSIQEFDTAELTTLLPLQPVAFTETTTHIQPFQKTELTSIKDGLIVASSDDSTKSTIIFDSETETESEILPKSTTGAIILANKTSTDNIYDTSSMVPLTEDNIITVLTEDVSDWDDSLKVVQEAESSSFESDSKEQETMSDLDEQEVVTFEISQEESSRIQTEIPISNHTTKITLDHTHAVVPGDTSTTGYSEITTQENIQTENTTDFKSVTDLLSTTTIDDETVTRKATESESIDDDQQSSLDELHSVVNASFAQTSENSPTNEKLDTISTHTEPDDDFTSFITKLVHLSTVKSPYLDGEDEIVNESDTVTPSEEVHFTTSDSLLVSIDSAQTTTELYQHGVILNASSDDDQYSTTSEASVTQDIYATSDSSHDIPITIPHDYNESSSDSTGDITDIEQTETHLNSFTTTDANEFPTTFHTIIAKETYHDTESVSKNMSVTDFQTSVEDLFSTSQYKESTASDISQTAFESLDEHSVSLNIKSTFSEHDNVTDSDYSNEIIESTINSIVKGITSSSKPSVDIDKYSTITTLKLESIHSTEPSISDNIHTSVDDKKYDSTVQLEVTGHDLERETTKIFEKLDESLNETDFDLIPQTEQEEAEAESEEITTESFLGQTSSDHPTQQEILEWEKTQINVTAEQTDEAKSTTKIMMTEDKAMTDDLNNIDYKSTHESLPTKYTSAESINPSETDLTLKNTSNGLTQEIFSATEITSYTTESLTDSFKIKEIDTEERTKEDLISKTDSFTDDFIRTVTTTPKTDISTSQPQSTLEIFSEPATAEETIDDAKEKIDSVKEDEEISTTFDASITQLLAVMKTTTEPHITKKISTTTEDDMPNELPAFEPPIANILKQHMLFNRPASQKEPSDSHSAKPSISKHTSDESQVEKLSLTVEETDENSLDLDELGNRIISFNQEYTIQESEIMSTTAIPDNEDPNSSNENRNNLYFSKAEYDDATQTSSNAPTSTQIIYNEYSTSETEEPTLTQKYDENEDLISNIDIMDSEELPKEIILKEEYGENIPTNNSESISLYDTMTGFNVTIFHTENNPESTETISQEVSEKKSDSSTENTPTINLDFSDHSTLVDVITTEGHMNEGFELSSHNDLIDELFNKDLNSLESSNKQEEAEKFSHLEDNKQETDSDFVYEDAESSENLNDTNSIQTSTAVEELQTHLIPAQPDRTSLSDEHETSTEPQTISSVLDYTSITSDSAKEEYLVALKFSTLYGQKFFSTSQQYQTFATDSSEMHNGMSSTLSSDNDELNNITDTSDSSEITHYEHFTQQQFQNFNQDHLTSVYSETSKHSSELDSLLTFTSTEEEKLSTSKEHSTDLSNSDDLFSTLKYLDNLLSETDTTTDQHVTEIPTQSNSELSTDQKSFDSSLSMTITKIENFTKPPDQSYSSRLKNELAEYGVLGGVFITGKSKYQGNTTKELDKNSSNSTNSEFSNAENEASPIVENMNVVFHNYSGDLEIENDAELDYSHTSSELHTRHTTKNILENIEENESDYDATENENQGSLETEIISTAVSSDETKLIETSTNSETYPEISTTIPDLTSGISSDEILPLIAITEKIAEISDTQIGSEDVDNDYFITKIEIEQEKGPEKGGDWFEPTDPNIILANENSSDATSQFNNSTVESTPERGPEKGGDVFEPTLPNVFPINNANLVTKNDTTNGTGQISTSETIDLSSEEILNKGVTKITSLVTESKNDLETTTESIIKLDFVPPLPILLKSFPKLVQFSNNSRNNSENIEIVNNHKISNVNLNDQYMSDQGKVEIPSRTSYERNHNPSYDLSGIISKVFKAPGYESEVHLDSLKDYSDLKKKQFLRLKRDVNTHSGTPEVTQPKPNNKFPPSSDEDIYLLKNKNILLVEGYGRKQSDFIPVTSSLIIVHSDEENEAEVDSKENKPADEPNDILISDFLDEIMSTNPEKSYMSSDLNESHPKV